MSQLVLVEVLLRSKITKRLYWRYLVLLRDVRLAYPSHPSFEQKASVFTRFLASRLFDSNLCPSIERFATAHRLGFVFV